MKKRTFQQGFAAVAAIFLVVGLAALGAFMVTLSNSQQLTSAQDLQGTKAYWAARAGLEWGISSVASATTCPAVSGAVPVRTQLTVDSFSVCISCSYNAYSDPTSVAIYQLTSAAYSVAPSSCTDAAIATLASGNAGSLGYIERSLSASLEK